MAALQQCAGAALQVAGRHSSLEASRTGALPLSRSSRPLRVRAHGAEEGEAVDGRAFRRALNKSDNYNRSGFGHKKEMLARMEEEYTSKDGIPYPVGVPLVLRRVPDFSGDSLHLADGSSWFQC